MKNNTNTTTKNTNNMEVNEMKKYKENEVDYYYFNSATNWTYRNYVKNPNGILVCWGQGWNGNYYLTYFDDHKNDDRYFEFNNYDEIKEFFSFLTN